LIRGDSSFFFASIPYSGYQFGKKGDYWGELPNNQVGVYDEGYVTHMVFVKLGYTCYAYQNGKLVLTQAFPSTKGLKVTTDSLRIGYGMGGNMYRVRFWQTNFSADQVKQLFNNGDFFGAAGTMFGISTLPTLDLRPENATATVWYDASTHHHDGILTNATLTGAPKSLVGEMIQMAVSDTSVPSIGKIIYNDADSSFYGCRSITSSHKWWKLN